MIRCTYIALALVALLAACSDDGDSAKGQAPTADAGSDQTVPKRDIVRLDASGSTDPDTDSLSFSWTQVSGPDIVITNKTGATTSFTAPGEEGTVVLELLVSDGQSSDTDQVSIQIANHQPVAAVGGDQSAPPGGRVALDGSSSSDPDGDPLTHSWSQISGMEVSLSSNSSATPFFDAPADGGNLVFQLIVNDGTSSSVPVQAVVSVLAYSGDTISLSSHPFRRGVQTTGNAKDVVVSEGLAYVAAGSQGLVVVDTAASGLSVTGSVAHTGEAVGVDVAGSLAFVAAENGGLRVIDVTNPQSPALLGDAGNGNAIVDVAVGEGRAYVADRAGGITIFDIANPATPTELGRARVSTGESTCIAVVSTVAYVGGGAELAVVDGERAETPQRRAQFPSAGPVRGVATAGDVLAFSDDEKVTLLNISTLLTPAVRGTWVPRGPAAGLSISNDRLFVTVPSRATVEVVDISDPANPSLLGAYSTPGPAIAVHAVDDVALVADGDVQVVGIANPENPTLVSEVPLAGAVNALDVLSGVAYLAGPDLTLVEASQPASPSIISIFPTEGEAMDVVVDGNDVYLASSEGGLVVVNVADRNNPQAKGAYDTRGPATAVAVSPGVAFVASGSRIEVIDTTRPPNYTLHNSYPTDGSVESMLADGEDLFIADGPGGLVILDVGNPRNPSLIGAEPTPTDARAVAKDGDTLYLADGIDGLFVFDVIDPSSPELLAQIPTPFAATDIRVEDGFAYVTTGAGGVAQFDVSNPDEPMLIGAYNAGQSAGAIDLSQGLAWVLDVNAEGDRSALYALDVTDTAVGALDESYDEVSPGLELRYHLSGLDPALEVACLVTGGACTVVSVDRMRNTATLSWELPQTMGDYEIAVAVGEHRLFRLAGRDQVFVR
jgi:hypothetical protein